MLGGDTMKTFVLFVLCTFLLEGVVSDAGPGDAKRLYDDLLMKSGYNRHVRPAASNVPLEVQFGLSLQKLNNIDVRSQTVSADVWLNLEWKDPQLTWNSSAYGNTRTIVLPLTEIWQPDIELYNRATDSPLDKSQWTGVVYSDGTVSSVPPVNMVGSAYLDMTYFPFDEQHANFKFGSWHYDGSKINVTSRSTKIDLSTYQVSHEWDLKNTSAKRHVQVYECCPEPYIDITFTMHLARRGTYHTHLYVAPSIALMFLLPTLFILPPLAKQKMILGSALLISQTVMLGSVENILPGGHASMPVFTVYYLTNIILTCISLFFSACVINFWYKGDHAASMPKAIQCFLGTFGRLLCVQKDSFLESADGTAAEGMERQGQYQELSKHNIRAEWRQLAVTLDRLLLVVFIVTTLIVICVMVR